MINAFLILFVGGILACILERLFPHYTLPKKKNWYFRATIFNFLQLFITILGHYTWERWITGGHSLFRLDRNLTPFVGGLLAYFILTWVFYWWHRVRHESEFIWRVFHQFHHSPERIEVFTSFYKHPLEIVANSIIITILMYPILGLSLEANAWLTVFSGFGEFFYHMNIKTPYWLGYIIQRPESHCLHHIRDKRFCKNYADIPIWDILGGTFENPTEDCLIGFSDDKELLVKDMMLCKNILKKRKGKPNREKKELVKHFLYTLLVLVGCLSTIGLVCNSDSVRGLGFSSVASPLPFVFSAYNGVETFSTKIELDLILKNGTLVRYDVDNQLYKMLKGPYNLRNMYGVILSHGPFFDKENMIKMRNEILDWSICEPGTLVKDLGIFEPVGIAWITTKSKTEGFSDKVWTMTTFC